MKYKDKILGSRYGLFVLLSIFIIIVSFISSISTTTSGLDAVKFVIFQIGGMLIPGLAILKLFPVKCRTREEQLLLAYVDGYILSMAMYLIVMTINLEKYVTLLYLGISIISIVIIATKHKDEEPWPINEKIDIVPWIFLAVLLFVSWLVFSMHWSVSLYTTEFNDDVLFWVGDIVSLEKKFLPLEFRSLAPNRRYHYGGAMQIALICNATGISAFNLAIHFSYIQSMILLVFSGYCIGIRLLKSRKNVILMLFLMMFSTGLEDRSFVTYIWHIFIQPMSFNVALSLELIILLLLLLQLGEEKINYKVLCRILLLIGISTITKGSSGAIALCIIWGVFAWLTMTRRKVILPIVYCATSAIVFLIIYIFLMDTGSAYVVDNAVIKENVQTTQVIQNSVSNLDVLKRVGSKIIGYVQYLFYVNPFTFVPAVLYGIYCVLKKRMDMVHWICSSVIFIGTILGYCINYVGKSQMYFTLAVFPFAALLSALAIYEMLSVSKQNIIQEWKKNVILVAGCCFVLFFSWVSAYHNCVAEAFYVGCSNLGGNSWEDMQNEYKYDKLTYEEYEGYDWIRLNTEGNALFLSDRMLEESIICQIPGVFCERYIYPYRTSELESGSACYDGDEESILYYADKGIRYIIQNKRISPNFTCSEEMAVKLYDNNYIAVYELQDSSKWKNL